MSSSSLSRRRQTAPRTDALARRPGEASRRPFRAQEEERKRISQELHDGIGQGLMALRLHLGVVASQSPQPEAHSQILEALKLLDHSIEDLRRIVGRFSPRSLEELGLLAAIRKEARDLSRNMRMKARLEMPSDLRSLTPELEVALYRSLQEALHNIAKHSQARNFSIRLEQGADSISILIRDDGVGFSGNHASARPTFGFHGMKERIATLGGSVRIRSAKGSGTQITITLPLPAKPLRKHALPERRLPPAFPSTVSSCLKPGRVEGA